MSRFADLAGQAAEPIDDVRGSTAYRVHALRVLSRRMLGWAWEECTGYQKILDAVHLAAQR